MNIKGMNNVDLFLKEIKKIIYPQLMQEAEKAFRGQKSAINLDGSVSKAAREVLKYGRDLKRGRNIGEIVEEIYQNHKKDSVVEEESFRFILFALAYFIPKGSKVFTAYNERAGIKINPLLKEKMDKIFANRKVYDAELELERVKKRAHKATKEK